jgi:hypothetical protein
MASHLRIARSTEYKKYSEVLGVTIFDVWMAKKARSNGVLASLDEEPREGRRELIRWFRRC